MKKFFLLTLVISLFTLRLSAKTHIGIAPELGMNIYNMTADAPGVTSYMRVGFKAGINFDKFLTDKFSLQAGAFFTQSGAKRDINQVFVGPVRVPITVNNVQVPIDLFYRMKYGPGKLIFSAGPYVGYALSIAHSASDTAFDATNMKIGTDTNSYIKPLDIGLNFNAGYEMPNGWFAKIGYAFSLLNISAQNGQTIRNSVFSISIGWFYRSTKVKVENKAY